MSAVKPKTLPFSPSRLTATQVADYIENGLSPKESKEADDQWAVSHCNLAASLIRKHLVLHWTKDLPTEPGYYWMRSPVIECGPNTPHIYRVSPRVDGVLVVDWHRKLELYRGQEWAGPISPPEESAP